MYSWFEYLLNMKDFGYDSDINRTFVDNIKYENLQNINNLNYNYFYYNLDIDFFINFFK